MRGLLGFEVDIVLILVLLTITGVSYSQQSYKVSESFPYKWINKKWKEGYHVTTMATAGNRWVVVMSKNAGYTKQVVELDFLYPSEGIHQRWGAGYRITSTAATPDQAAFILSMKKKKQFEETQETLRTSTFPVNHVKVHLRKNGARTCTLPTSAMGEPCVDDDDCTTLKLQMKALEIPVEPAGEGV
ncbi:hypothetical protein EJB05_54708, partial [Eragrostis curvula]